MFGGYDNDGNGGPAGLFAQLAAGFGGLGPGARLGRAHPRAYDEYFKAYSVAMLAGKERLNLSYGGKIIMPPSQLAALTNMELESPWLFQLRNPSNPAASTHAGVLEFIAEEGVVHLPYWMMKTLRLNEGDPIRITGAALPKGKMVKLQPQSVDFLEISDPKAVLEQALRNFSTLTQGDIVEISYNCLTFEILIMEIVPAGAGISIVDTDLEVDFAPPKGYVEPKRPAPAPPPTMASKLKIDLNASSPGSSRPSSALGGGGATNAPGGWESFKGRGETLGGRKTKGKGISAKKIEDVPEGSRITRTDQQRIVRTDDLEGDVHVPAALNLPHGKLFFGYAYVPPKPTATKDAASPAPTSPPAFTGSGNTLSGGVVRAAGKGKEKAEPAADDSARWGQGHTMGSKAAEPAPSSAKPARRSPSIDWDYYDDSADNDDDVIEIDSD